MRVPFGVVGIIYEARPNVTADAGGICLKSGNAAPLRGPPRLPNQMPQSSKQVRWSMPVARRRHPARARPTGGYG